MSENIVEYGLSIDIDHKLSWPQRLAKFLLVKLINAKKEK
jgi:hypothetical protein